VKPTRRKGHIINTSAVAIRLASPHDLAWCITIEHTAGTHLAQKIAADEVIIAELAGDRVGYLRLDYLWCVIPYIGLIRVEEAHRKQGIGRGMLDFVEALLRERGHHVLLSSSQADEAPPQAWHRHVGFVECGFLAGINEGGIGEVFFRKRL
jgi:GNAT superfamily N-acetyltransferase